MARKKTIALLLAALLCLSACGRLTPPAETSAAEQTTEQAEAITSEDATTAKHYPPPKPPESVQTEYVFSRDYAKTPTHFYAVCTKSAGENWKHMLYRAPLSDISKREEIPLPEEHKGRSLKGINVCGVTAQWLFVSRWEGKYDADALDVLYQVSLKTGEATVLDEGKYATYPWYNAASGSILIARMQSNGVQLEALRLVTGERKVIFELAPAEGVAQHWHNTLDGMVAFADVREYQAVGNAWVVVDKDDRAVPMEFSEIKLFEPQPDNKAIQALRSRYAYFNGAVAGDVVCYVDEMENKFYRVNTDGSGTKFLWELEPISDGGYSPEPLDGMILLIAFGEYGTEHFHALYDPATDALFSAR